MSTKRPSIPAETERAIFVEAGHRCACCGVAFPLERAHIVPWRQSRDHNAKNLLCLCANCHEMADRDWDMQTFFAYKRRPWVNRQGQGEGPSQQATDSPFSSAQVGPNNDHAATNSEAGQLRILVARSRPSIGLPRPNLPKEKKTRDPRSVEYKPEWYTDVEPDSVVIQKTFQEAGRNIYCEVLDNVNMSDLADALTEKWDIVHLDCIVGTNETSAKVYLNDGSLSAQSFRELLSPAEVALLVFMDCDSLRIVQSSFSANVMALVAITGSLPVLAAERFCCGFYRSIARGKSIEKSFADAKSLCAVELPHVWDSSLFVLSGDGALSFSQSAGATRGKISPNTADRADGKRRRRSSA